MSALFGRRSRAATEPREVFEAVGLSKSFSGVRALSDVSFSLHPGRILGIIGPNGAGKSTFINVATGLFRPDAGRVVFEGRDVTRASLAARGRAGLMRSFQHARTFGSLTVREALQLAAESPRARAAAPATGGPDAVLRRFGLAAFADTITADAPYGVQKIVNLALVAQCAPKVLFLDEPFAGVGPDDVARISEVVETIRDEGVAIGLVEHNIEALLRLADRVVVLDSGRVIFEGTPDEARTSAVVREAYLGGSSAPANGASAA
jgi:ABC-type branched-subunit amino acid transport system ATPase component